MNPQPSTSPEDRPAEAGAPPRGELTRLEAAVVLGILLIGLASCLVLYGRPILAMLSLLWQSLAGA